MRRCLKWLAASVLALVFAACCPAAQLSVEEAAELILKADLAREPMPAVSALLETADTATAYKVQNVYVAKKLDGDEVAGFKGAMTSQALMNVFGASSPAIGVLPRSGLMADGAEIVLDRAGIMLEEEIGYRFNAKIDSHLASVDEVKAAVLSVFPAIEVPLASFVSMKGLNSVDMISANVGGMGCIVGAERPLDGVDVNAIVMNATCDGQPFNSGAGTDALGDQWRTLLGLVNTIIDAGYTIEPGQFIISGAMGKMLPATPGEYVVDYGDFGVVKFSVKE